MASSISDREPQLNDGVSTVAGDSVRLTVTGLDENGQMFREAAPILHLNGRDCSFRSKFRPDIGSWMLFEIDLSNQGSKRSSLHGQVRTVQPEGTSPNFYQVRVDLEYAQEVRIGFSPQKERATAVESPAIPVSAAKKDGPEFVTKTAPSTALARVADSPTQGATSTTPLPAKIDDSKGIPATGADPVKPPQPVSAKGQDQEAANSAIASEVTLQLAALRGSVAQDLERIAQRTMSVGMEQIVREAVEKQIAVSYQAAIETLNSDLAYQLVGRLAGSKELRNCIEKLAKAILDEQVGISRTSAIEAQQNLNSKVTEMTRLFEASMADMEARLKVARDSVAAILDRVQTLESEVGERARGLQKTADQLNQAARTTIEKFDGHVTSQLNSWSSQFKKHLDEVSKEKSAQFATDLQQQLAAPRESANEVVEKLTAGLQLARGALRIQEEQMAGLSKVAAAEFEKEIKAVLLHLAGSA